jgi:hypothetical protein
MCFSEVDQILSEWASNKSLFLLRKYQDSDVRSVEIASSTGTRYQIWIDRPKCGDIRVHAWDYKRRQVDWEVPIGQLSKCLNNAIETIEVWKMEEPKR